jgi:hypothetical protein
LEPLIRQSSQFIDTSIKNQFFNTESDSQGQNWIEKHYLIRLRVRRSNFMRSKLFFLWDRIHEVEIRNNDSISWSALFHEIEIQIKALLLIRQFRSHDRFVSCKYDHEVEIQKSIIRNFDLMIDLLVPSTIMRLKFKINYINLVSCTCGYFLALIISHLCLKTFDLMIILVTNKSIMRSKLPNNALFWILISWSYLQLTNRSWDRNSKQHY